MHAMKFACMEIQFPKCAGPSNFRSGICLCPARIDRLVSVARVTTKREEIEREQNPASRHFLERITA